VKRGYWLTKGIALFLAMTLFLSACGEIPDISKFAEASGAMTSVIRKGVTQTHELMGAAAAEPSLLDVRKELTAYRAELRAALKPTLVALDAIDGYLDALQAIAAAHKKSAEHSEALVSAVGNVVTAATGLQLPAVALNIGNRIVKLYEELRLEKDFKKRVNLVAEIMEGKKNAEGGVDHEGVIGLLKYNMTSLKDINVKVSSAMLISITVRNQVITQYHDQIMENDRRVQRVLAGILEYKNMITEATDFSDRINLGRNLEIARLGFEYDRKLAAVSDQVERKKLEIERDEKIQDLKEQATETIDSRKEGEKKRLEEQFAFLTGIDAGLAPLKAQVGQAVKACQGSDEELCLRAIIIEGLERREASLLVQTTALTTDLQRVNPAYIEAIGFANKVNERKEALDALFDKSLSALDAWADTHAKLRTTLNTRQPLTATRLISVVREMLDIIKPEEKK
jgi:hypothetical protein